MTGFGVDLATTGFGVAGEMMSSLAAQEMTSCSEDLAMIVWTVGLEKISFGVVEEMIVWTVGLEETGFGVVEAMIALLSRRLRILVAGMTTIMVGAGSIS
jgi:hypothetical protein